MDKGTKEMKQKAVVKYMNIDRGFGFLTPGRWLRRYLLLDPGSVGQHQAVTG
jgi:hypothetical protein